MAPLASTFSKANWNSLLISLFCFFLFCLSSPLKAADLGGFFINHEAKLFLQPTMQGRHLLTRLKQAYQVLDIKEHRGKLILEILYPGRRVKDEGTGFILNSALLQENKEDRLIKVYPKLPEKAEELLDYKEIPFQDIQTTNQRHQLPAYPEVDWIPVRYTSLQPTRFWVYETQGFYRPEKNVIWIQNTYNQLLRLKYRGDKLEKLMQGMVEVGFSKLDVRLGLGSPINTVKLENSDEQEWIYPHLKIAFKSDRVVKVQ